MVKTVDDKTPNLTAATIDEALEKTHFGKFNIQIIVFAGFILNNVILESVGVSFALPVVACDLELSYQQQGVLGAVCFLGIILSSHCWGFLADTRGRKRTMRPALILGFIVTFLSSFSVNFEMMVILRFINGIFLSASSATIFAYIGEFHSQFHRNRAILLAALISAFSAILYPVIAWLFINQEWAVEIPFLGITYTPWRLYFVVCGLSGFGCGLVCNFLPESPKYLLGMGHHTEALEVLKFVHRKNTQGNDKLKNDVFEITTLLPDLDTPIRKLSNAHQQKSPLALMRIMWEQTAPLFMAQHIRKTLIAASIQFVTFFSAHGVYMWFPYILNNVMLYTETNNEPKCICDILRITQSSNNTLTMEAGEKICVTKLEISTYKHTAALEIMYVCFLLSVIYACKRFNRTPILFIVLTTCGLCGVLSLVIPIPLVAVYMFAVLLCCGLGTSVINTIVVDVFPTNLRAMAVCICLMLGRIGAVTGSNILGALIESHCEEALFSSSTALIIAGCLGFLMPKPKSTTKTQPQAIAEEEGNS